MQKETSRAKKWREIIKNMLYTAYYQQGPDAVNPDANFKSFLEKHYDTQKMVLEKPELLKEEVLRAEKNGLFIVAAGLFTFGRLDVAKDILDTVPGGEGTVKQVILVIKDLLPLPDNLNPRWQLELVKQWLDENTQNLVWNEQTELFEFKQ